MSGGDNSPGVSDLTRAIIEAAKSARDMPSGPDFGEINKDLSLSVNGFSVKIPANDYLICRAAVGQIKPGERVLILWSGGDAVVVDRICEASEVL